MHRLHSSVARRGVGVHIARIVGFGAALTALTGIVVADVTAAEPDEPVALALVADRVAPADAIADERGPELLAAVVVVPDAVAAPTAAPPAPEPARPKKKRRAGKLKFGRFEGY